MKKFAVLVVLLLISVPLSAGVLGLSAGAMGGVEMWKINVEGAEMQTYPAFGAMATFSPPILPVGLRGAIEYTWKSETAETILGDVTTKISYLFILLGLEYSIAPPLSPASFYVGVGAEMTTTTASMSGALDISASSTDFGFLAYTGTSFTMGLMGFFAETGYGIIFMEGGSLTHIPIRGGIKISI